MEGERTSYMIIPHQYHRQQHRHQQHQHHCHQHYHQHLHLLIKKPELHDQEELPPQKISQIQRPSEAQCSCPIFELLDFLDIFDFFIWKPHDFSSHQLNFPTNFDPLHIILTFVVASTFSPFTISEFTTAT